MVVKMIKWRPWDSTQSKKFEAKIVVRGINGLKNCDDDEKIKNFDSCSKLMVEIMWKGSKNNGFRSLKKKSVKKNSTRAQKLDQNGVVLWDEEFKIICGFCLSKDRIGDCVFLPWEIGFLVLNGSQMGAKKKGPLAAPVLVNLADFASPGDANQLDINIPLSMFGCGFKCCPSLCISLSLTELRTTNEVSDNVQRPIMFAPLSPCFGGAAPAIKNDEGSTKKAGIRKAKSLTDFVSSRKSKKAYNGEASSDSKPSTGSDSDYNDAFDTDSFDGNEEGESEESRKNAIALNYCGYGGLVHVNFAGGALDLKFNCEEDVLVYYSNKLLKLDSVHLQEVDTTPSEQFRRQRSKFGISAWRKKKLRFGTPRVKGEPLLKKECVEGGDDIDFDRRQLSSDDSMTFEDSVNSGSMFSEFGDDTFAIGSWEVKELPSRDGSMKLTTQVFFASIDQRSERAAGESACTALVAVMADWIHANRGEMPIKSDFDSLIREGSLQWRTLCENEDYKERFPDKHFDLETILEAKIRPLAIVPERSFIGFFHPEGLEEESFHFLKDSMSFDDIWGEICQAALKLTHDSEPLVYIVSWNDHFFLLRVDWDAFYIIDTLGERLFEGCNQAFVLKFDNGTTIENNNEKDTDVKSSIVEKKSGSTSPDDEGSELIKGKQCCKEYIKGFLAAIPIRELQFDLQKGLASSTPLHQRLQIEFNYTAQILQGIDENTANIEASMVVDAPVPALVGDVQGTVTDNVPALVGDVQGSVTDDVPALVGDVQDSVTGDVQGPVTGDVQVSMMVVAAA